MDLGGFLAVGSAAMAGAMAGFLSGALTGALAGGQLGWRMDSLDRRLEQWKNAQNAPLGVEARKEKAERMSSAMAEAMMAMKSGKPPAEVIKEVAAKYPDVALDIGKKIAKQNGLGGILG